MQYPPTNFSASVFLKYNLLKMLYRPIQISFIDEKNEKKVIDYTAEHEAREKYKTGLL